MTPGTVISGAGHATLVLFLILGWGFDSDPLDFEVTEVSVISGSDFAALTSRPEPVEAPEEPAAPAAPPAEDTPPPPPTEEAPPPPEPQPTPPAPEPEPVQEAPPVIEETVSLPPPPQPSTDPVPELSLPEPPSGAPDLANSPRPQPRPVPRVAPEAAPPPPPEAEVADIVQEETVPDAAEPEIVEEEEIVEESTAPEEAAPEIVTEAETPAGGAPTSSPRPATRPNRPAPETPATETVAASENAAEPEPAEVPDTSAGVEDALAEALASEAATDAPAPQGPPLTGSEQEGFRVAVQQCWNVDVGSTSSAVTVTVAFNLSPDGRVEGDVRRVNVQGGDSAAQEAAFQSARRAILRCQADGYPLPAEKYDQWRQVEMTFDPSGMRLR